PCPGGGSAHANSLAYRPLRPDKRPETGPSVLASDRPPQGAGEVMLAPVAPAVAHALLRATGRRLDVMPFPDDAFRMQAENGPNTMSVKFSVNGKAAEFDGPEEVPLLWVVREHLGLTGSKFGCGIGACGACTMHVDGAAMRTCVMPVMMAVGKEITTIEGLSPAADHPVQRAWIKLDVPQCGYCQSGMIMAAAHLLQRHPQPTDQDIDRAMINLCRCATYVRIRAAIHLAAELARDATTGKAP